MEKVDNVIKGEVILGREQETKNGKTFYQVVVQTSDKPVEYPSPVAVDFWGDKVELATGLTEGSEVEIHVNIRGRQWQDKYYTSISGWKVDVTRDVTVTQEILDAADEAQASVANNATDDASSQLPF